MSEQEENYGVINKLLQLNGLQDKFYVKRVFPLAIQKAKDPITNQPIQDIAFTQKVQKTDFSIANNQYNIIQIVKDEAKLIIVNQDELEIRNILHIDEKDKIDQEKLEMGEDFEQDDDVQDEENVYIYCKNSDINSQNFARENQDMDIETQKQQFVLTVQHIYLTTNIYSLVDKKFQNYLILGVYCQLQNNQKISRKSFNHEKMLKQNLYKNLSDVVLAQNQNFNIFEIQKKQQKRSSSLLNQKTNIELQVLISNENQLQNSQNTVQNGYLNFSRINQVRIASDLTNCMSNSEAGHFYNMQQLIYFQHIIQQQKLNESRHKIKIHDLFTPKTTLNKKILYHLIQRIYASQQIYKKDQLGLLEQRQRNFVNNYSNLIQSFHQGSQISQNINTYKKQIRVGNQFQCFIPNVDYSQFEESRKITLFNILRRQSWKCNKVSEEDLFQLEQFVTQLLKTEICYATDRVKLIFNSEIIMFLLKIHKYNIINTMTFFKDEFENLRYIIRQFKLLVKDKLKKGGL